MCARRLCISNILHTHLMELMPFAILWSEALRISGAARPSLVSILKGNSLNFWQQGFAAVPHRIPNS